MTHGWVVLLSCCVVVLGCVISLLSCYVCGLLCGCAVVLLCGCMGAIIILIDYIELYCVGKSGADVAASVGTLCVRFARGGAACRSRVFRPGGKDVY